MRAVVSPSHRANTHTETCGRSSADGEWGTHEADSSHLSLSPVTWRTTGESESLSASLLHTTLFSSCDYCVSCVLTHVCCVVLCTCCRWTPVLCILTSELWWRLGSVASLCVSTGQRFWSLWVISGHPSIAQVMLRVGGAWGVMPRPLTFYQKGPRHFIDWKSEIKSQQSSDFICSSSSLKRALPFIPTN